VVATPMDDLPAAAGGASGWPSLFAGGHMGAPGWDDAVQFPGGTMATTPCKHHFSPVDSCTHGATCFYSHDSALYMMYNGLRWCPKGCGEMCRGKQCRACHQKMEAGLETPRPAPTGNQRKGARHNTTRRAKRPLPLATAKHARIHQTALYDMGPPSKSKPG
jgi:hypothetical protein